MLLKHAVLLVNFGVESPNNNKWIWGIFNMMNQCRSHVEK